ncbi:hypothetical protein TWF506_002534 [Arthrobotrys conoides]|uniref:Uncharacterized protein n=1 Tax=Arthrobotrys conoides TaxID=74498 RepID=A0AAN8NF60_9PEZI
MGQGFSTWYYDLVPYEPLPLSKRPIRKNLGGVDILGYYGKCYSDVCYETLWYNRNDPESLLNELLSFDMVGIIIGSKHIPKSEYELYIFGEDKIDSSILPMDFRQVYVVYPEKYKWHVPYYIGCESIRLGEFKRPRKLDVHNEEADHGREVDATQRTELRGWNIVDKKMS